MSSCLLPGYQSLILLSLYQGVIFGQLFQASLPEAIRAAITDVSQEKTIIVKGKQFSRTAHS